MLDVNCKITVEALTKPPNYIFLPTQPLDDHGYEVAYDTMYVGQAVYIQIALRSVILIRRANATDKIFVAPQTTFSQFGVYSKILINKMDTYFNGKRALVTGAGQGIGRAIVKALVKCGAHVVAVSRTKSHLDSLKQECPSIELIMVNLANWTEAKIALAHMGDIDLLVNNAGVAILEPLLDVTEEHCDKTFDINVKAVINLTQMVARNMIERKVNGSIVNLSSQASHCGLQDHTVYCASKGAVDAFTRAAALELGPKGIRVNCVNPTVIMTEMGKLGWSDPAKADPMLEKIPLRRFGNVYEVVDSVMFLLSSNSSLITGACLNVDGGYAAV